MFRHLQHSTITRVVGLMLFLMFFGASFYSLSYAPMGGELPYTMIGCPFMAHDVALCSMSTFEHIDAWKAAFFAVVPTLIILFFAGAGVFVVQSVLPHLRRCVFRLTLDIPRDIAERIYTFSYRPLQDLFSNGILHPKLF